MPIVTDIPKRPSAEPKYPFMEWVKTLRRRNKKCKDGSLLWCRLYKDKDYDCSSHSMAQYLWRHARREGIKIGVSEWKDCVYFSLKD